MIERLVPCPALRAPIRTVGRGVQESNGTVQKSRLLNRRPRPRCRRTAFDPYPALGARSTPSGVRFGRGGRESFDVRRGRDWKRLWRSATGQEDPLTPRWQFSATHPNIMSLIQSAKLNGHDPYRYLEDVLERPPTQPASRIEDLLPHCWLAARTCCDLIPTVRCGVLDTSPPSGAARAPSEAPRRDRYTV
jgi:IS66 C-terminal element